MTNVFNVKNKKTITIGTLLIIVLMSGVFYAMDVLNINRNKNENITQYNNHVLKIGTISIKIDIADTPMLQERGLSGRKQLLDDQGMYFIFSHPDFYQFWMKEMNFPIDIIWIDENMSVVDITQGALPSSFPKTFVSRTPARYVLEVSDGFTARHGVNIGDQVLLDPPEPTR